MPDRLRDASPPAVAATPLDTLLGTLRPVFAQIKAGAVERELGRRLPRAEIALLRDAGYGRLRVPRAYGGHGASIEDLVTLMIDLGAADSNVVQALRGHVGFVEFVLAHPDTAFRDRWLRRIAAGALVGNAESEAAGTFADIRTEVRVDGARQALHGVKYYTTGSLFADWMVVSAARTDPVTGKRRLVSVPVSTTAPGVSIIDDWDGFGQRLTASGTATFEDVEIDPADVHQHSIAAYTATVLNAVFQLVHLAALAGIARAALDEIADFVRSRPRNVFNPGFTFRQDPVALQIIGETFGAVETVRGAVLAAARTVDHASRLQLEGRAEADDFARADAHVYGVQSTVIDLVLRTVTRVFEVGGASATARTRALDRLWRNARTIASHNPAILRQQAVGDYCINDVAPSSALLAALKATPPGG